MVETVLSWAGGRDAELPRPLFFFSSRRRYTRCSRDWSSDVCSSDLTNWTDGDNNAGFHSRTIVMTPNPSQSIPAAQFFNKDDAEKKNYFDNMATIEWPDGPDGDRKSVV